MHVAFVESNTTGTGRLAFEQLRAGGHDVTLFARQRSKYPFLDERHRVRTVDVETNDFTRLSEALDRVIGEAGRPDALLTFSTFYVATAARLAERHSLPHLDPRTAEICHHKPTFRRAIRGAGLPAPPFWVVGSRRNAIRAARATEYPCIVKPSADSGSNGVRLVSDAGELVAQCEHLLAIATNDRGQPTPGDCLVEGLLRGPEYSVETMTVGGRTTVIGITAKHLSSPPYFVEMGHDFPADVTADVRDCITKAAVDALAAVAYDFGPAHTEVKLTASGAIVVEINPRLAGGMIPELVRLAHGVDLIGAVLSTALARPAALAPTRSGVASIRFITPPRDGFLRRAPNLAAARHVDLVTHVQFDRTIPSDVTVARHAGDRLGFVIAAGSDRSAVMAAADRAVALCQLELDIEDARPPVTCQPSRQCPQAIRLSPLPNTE